MTTDESTTPAKALWNEMASVVPPYPSGVVAVPQPLPGTAFFPGGLGLWFDSAHPLQPFPKDFMVVGQDFNTYAAYERAQTRGSEVNSSPTWRNLQQIFPKLDVPVSDCFFTNVYMGLREVGPETGRFPGARDRGFAQRCASFFKRQVEMSQPKVILTLGVEPLRILAGTLFRFPAPPAISRCDRIYGPFMLSHGDVALVALTQPALYFANIARRRFREQTGLAAEVAGAFRESAFPKPPITTP